MKASNRWWTAGVSGLICIGMLLSYDFSERGARFGLPSVQAKTDRSGMHDLGRARLLNKVVGHIRSHYVEPERVIATEMAVAAMQAIQSRVPEVLVSVERDGKSRPQAISASVGEQKQRFELTRLRDLYELNWKLMDIFRFLQRHLPPATDLEDIEYAAVNGLLSTLDPHSVLLTPQVYREMQLGTHGKFGGLGIVISIRDGVLTVMSVMDETPAFRAGLNSGDRILQIGEESSVNMRLNEAVNRLRGDPGSQVTIQVRREGHGDLLSFTITREEIRVRAVDHQSLEEGLGYVRIRSFQGNTFDDLNEILALLSKRPEGLKGLVLDLRENPGGLLDQAIKVSDLFLKQGTIVSTIREGARQREERHATNAGTSDTLPVVVLINRGSASASEIVAGALKHNERALIVGSTSFGKGSVQVLYQIDDAALKLTIAQYLTPGDISIQSVGITPDIEIQRVTAKRNTMDLFPDELGYKGEAGLESHLDSDKTQRDEASVRFRLVESDENKTDGDKPIGTQGDEPYSPDSLVRLAMDILKAAPVANRPTALVQASGLLKRRQKEEDLALQDKLKGMGVDWTDGVRKGPPSLKATLSVHSISEPGRTRLVAGDKVQIQARVRNEGKRDAYRVHGVIGSRIRALNALELVFGRIPAGQERTWSTTATLGRSMSSQGDEISLNLLQDGESLEDIGATIVQVNALPAPRFSASFVVDDAQGNGDGLIQRGESISLAVRITNVGEGPAESLLASVKNESGESVYIRSGRKKLGELPVGQSAVAVFELEVREGLRTQDIQLQLSLLDQERSVWLQSPIALPAFPTDFPAAAPATGWVSASEGTLQVHGGAHEDSPVIATVEKQAILPLEATTDRWLRVALAPGDDPTTRGWVRAGRVSHREDAKKAQWSGVTRRALVEPPHLVLKDSVSTDLATRAKEITLEGHVQFTSSSSGHRHVYVFLGDEKIFFRPVTEEDANSGPVSFSSKLTLAPGRNQISIVAREGPDDVTREHIVLFRQDGR